MSVTLHELQQFNSFAQAAISAHGNQLTLEELWDQWRLQHPTDEEARNDLLAVKAAISDMEAGDRGIAVETHIQELRKRYDLPAQS